MVTRAPCCYQTLQEWEENLCCASPLVTLFIYTPPSDPPTCMCSLADEIDMLERLWLSGICHNDKIEVRHFSPRRHIFTFNPTDFKSTGSTSSFSEGSSYCFFLFKSPFIATAPVINITVSLWNVSVINNNHHFFIYDALFIEEQTSKCPVQPERKQVMKSIKSTVKISIKGSDQLYSFTLNHVQQEVTPLYSSPAPLHLAVTHVHTCTSSTSLPVEIWPPADTISALHFATNGSFWVGGCKFIEQ